MFTTVVTLSEATTLLSRSLYNARMFKREAANIPLMQDARRAATMDALAYRRAVRFLRANPDVKSVNVTTF